MKTKLRDFLQFIAFLVLLVSASVSIVHAAERPNIVLIHMEDMGRQIGPYGYNAVQTPALDRLASQGMVFELGASVTAASCAPSRGSLLSGLYPHQNGMHGFGFAYRRGLPTYFDMLRDAGYFTGITYKTGVNFLSGDDQTIDMNFGYTENRMRGKKTPHLTTNSIENFEFFLDKRPKNRPFFFQAQTPDTHTDWMAEKQLIYIENQHDGHPYGAPERSEIKPLRHFGPDIKLTDRLEQMIWDYHCAIQRTDYFVDAVLNKLEAHGLTDNTLVIFTSDHGPSEFPRGKATPYRFGVRVPFIASWPDTIEPGTRSEALVSFVDILPTFLDAADIERPNYLPGHSLLPIFQGEREEVREYVFTAYTTHWFKDTNYWPNRTVFDGRYKLIHNLIAETDHNRGFPTTQMYTLKEAATKGTLARRAIERSGNPPQFELYDLKEDPAELHNLADNHDYKLIKNRLRGVLQQWREGTKDPFLERKQLQAFTKDYLSEVDDYHDKNESFDMKKWIEPWSDSQGYAQDPPANP